MKKLLLFLFFVTLSWACLAQTIKYVKPNGAGTKDGSSWANASDDLQDMINKSVGNFQDPSQNQIWVAAGTYKPNRKADALTTITLNNRDNAFVLKADVKIYGGFPATGTPTMANRNWNSNPTILSGDLGVTNNNSDNAYHVVIGAFDFGGQELNGFIITGGNANGNNNISVNTRNIFQKRGAGVYAENTSFLLTNVQIIDNSATEYGGGIYNIFSSPILTNVSIIGNSAGTGGGLYNSSGSMSLTNATITGNTATTSTSELFQGTGSQAVNLRNSIVFGTSANAVVLNSASVSYSLVSGISSTANDNINTTGLTATQIFTNAAGNNFSPAAGSPAINAGNNAYITQSTDLAGNTRVQKDRVDIGAYESTYDTAPVPDANGVLYVKKNGAGNKTGSSWQHAIGELANALVAAKGNAAIKEIWVAGGTYKPMYGPTNGANFTDQNRDNTFLLVNDVKIYGGFPATGTPIMVDRNWISNPTVLSGDLGTVNSNTDNAYHIVVVTGLTAATLDGLTIQDGFADGNTSYQYPGNSIARSNGAGLLITNSSNIAIVNCLIKGNIAQNNGAGIFQASASTITNSRFIGNKALNNGGAMFNSYADPIITNCSFSGNMATFFAGGTKAGAMYNNGASPTITNCTFTGNTASGGDFGGIYNTDGAQPIISNSIFWDNQGTQIQDANGSASTVTYSIVQGGFVGTGNLDANPLFVNAATGDYNLQATSPAINAGNNAAIPAGIATDLVGQVRIQRNRVDLGAYESAYSTAPTITPANGIIYVKKGATGEGSSWQNAAGELADALKFAKTNNAVAANAQVTQIWVAKGTYKPLYRADNLNGADATDRDNAFLLVDKVKVYGGFPDAGNPTLANVNPTANPTILSGNLGANKAYHVVIAVGATQETLLDGFTITEGNANGTGINAITVNGKSIYQAYGGGMYNINASVTIKNCTFSNNTTVQRGGAMVNDAASPIITNCNFTNNSATDINFSYAGAMYNVSSSNPLLTNCSFETNTVGRYGGAIYNYDAAPIIINSIFKQNRANNGNGGAIYDQGSSSSKFANTVFYANYANGSGGAFYNDSSSPALTNCTFYGNTIGGSSLNGQAVFTSGNGFVLNNSILWVNDGFIADGVLNGQVNGLNNFIQQTGGPANNPVASYTAAQLFTNAPIGDLTLKAGSPAINAGQNSVVTTAKDFAGNDRIRNNTVDLGAYEVQSGNTVSLVNIVPTNGIVYVKQGAIGNGSSWSNAAPELADALLAAKDLNAITAGSVTQIWVAGGTYKPLYSPEDGVNFGANKGSDNAFLLVKDVKLYGGFAGGEIQVSDRNWQLNPTILSGEIQGDANMTNNAYHVVIAAGDVGSATLDGFTVTEGSGINGTILTTITINGIPFFKRVAGGVYNNNSSLLVKNCIITNNSGYEASGFGSEAGNPILINTVISKNKNIYNFYSNAFYAYSGSPKLVNVSIVSNEGTMPIVSFGNNSELSNSIVWGNTVLGTPQSFLNLIIKNSIVQREAIIRVGLDVDPLFVDAANGDFSLTAGSPAIGTGDNSLYEAASASNILATDKDLVGKLRLQKQNIDMGAYESPYNPTPIPDAAGIVYVKQNGSGTFKGNSWANAAPELADALVAAKTNANIQQIWVAKGIYKPLYSPADHNFGTSAGRDNAFLLVKDVKVYGGFAGTETAVVQRNLANTTNKSTLSGDLNADDVRNGAGATLSFSNNNENVHHVLIAAGNIGTAELNGFTITGGNGNGTTITVNGLQLLGTHGGGMNITSSSPTLSNCIFEYNQVQTGMGGALYIGTPTNEAVSAPLVSKSSFVNNKSDNIAGVGWIEEGGGALYNSASSPIVTDCVFTGNLVTGSRIGGAIANNGLTMEVSNTAINNNISLGANGGGSGLANSGTGQTILKNVILSGNYTEGKGGAIYNNPGAISLLQNVLISGNQAIAGAGVYNNGSSPVLTNVTIAGNQANLGGGIYNINSSSPLLQNTVVFGNSTGVINNLPADIPTYKNSLVQGLSTTGLIPFSGTATDLFVQPLTPALAVGGDYKPKSGSVLVNAGDNTLFTNLDGNTKDLAGNTRLKGANIDLGAYELQSQSQVISPIATITKIYGDAPFVPGGISSSGLVVGYASADNSIAEAYQDTADGNKWKLKLKKAGTVQITASQAGGENNGDFYDPALDVVFDLVVNKKQVMVTLAGTFSKIYDGTTNAALGITNLIVDPNAIVGTDQLAVSSGVTGIFNDKNVGTGKTVSVAIANVSLTGAAVANYSLANSTTLTAAIGEITVRAITVTAQTDTKVYDGTITSSAIPLITSGTIAAGDQLSTAAIQKFDNKGAGTSKVLTATGLMVADGNGGGNYQITYVAVSTGVITPKPIMVTAMGKTKVYGELDPALTYGFTPALVGSDGFTGALARTVGEAVGSYPINIGTLSLNSNYVLNYTGANLTIGRRPITVTAMAKSRMFGEADPALTYTYVPALVGGDSFTGSLSRTQGEDVGHYPINIGSLSLNGNYTINYTGADLTITLRTLTITADAKQKTYGDTDPLLTYTSNGLMGLDAVTGSLSRVAGEDIGTYAIGRGSLTAGINYEVVYVPAKLTIAPRVVTITADAKQKTYGDADPSLTYSSTGLLAGDVVNGSLARKAGEDIGTYPINKGTLSVGGNYTLNYVGANLAINKKIITVTAVAKGKVYGDVDPILTYTSSPALLAGDSFIGALGRTTGEDAGTYQIGQETLTASGNYMISYQPASFTIEKAVLLVKANNAQMCQGASLPSLTLSYSGFRNGDGENSIPTRPAVGTTANSGSPAGSYTLVPSGGSATNYSFSYANGTLTINALPQVSISSNRGNNISRGETLQLTASGGTGYSWSGPGGILSGQNSVVLTIRPTASGTYTVRATNASGCSSEQSFTVTVRDDFQAIRATNLLTPNGDGINDVWKVENIDVYPDNEVVVFDRAGRVLYRKKGYDNSWNGMVNGSALAEGTYYYVIDFGNGRLKQKGFITLIREGR